MNDKKIITLDVMREFNEKKTKNIFIAEDGSTSIQGTLKVSGQTVTQDTQSLVVKDNIIVTNANGDTLVDNAGFAVRTGSDSAYGIMYDPIGDGVKIGLGKVVDDKKFVYDEDEAQFLATRDDSIENGNLVYWNDTEKTLVDTGFKLSDIYITTDQTFNGESANPQSGIAIAKMLQQLQTQIDDITYKPITINNFALNITTAEYGQTITDIILNWSINKTPVLLTLNNDTLDNTLTSKTISDLSVTKDTNTKWLLKATDERGNISQKETSISFANGIYYGVSKIPAVYDSVFVKSLSKTLSNNKARTLPFTTGVEEYIYYCIPERLGTCSFTVGGFTGGFSEVTTISFTNNYNYTENYRIYRSDKANTGSISVVIN